MNEETRTVGEWRAWAETRLVNADGMVDRLRGEGRAAVALAQVFACADCVVRVTVPVRGGRYVWEGAWSQHELYCPRA